MGPQGAFSFCAFLRAFHVSELKAALTESHLLQQEPDAAGVPLPDGSEDDGDAVLVHRVHVRALANKVLQDLQLAVVGREVARAAAVHGGVDVCALEDE